MARKQLEGNREEYDDNLERLRGALAENEKKIAAQLSDLSIAEGTAAKGYIIKIIDELHGEGEIIRSRIAEMESLAANHILSNIEFDIIRQMLTTFRDTLDNMSVENMKKAIEIIDGRAETECSGNVTKENIEKLTALGVDYISSGALTHSAPILDLSLKNLQVK